MTLRKTGGCTRPLRGESQARHAALIEERSALEIYEHTVLAYLTKDPFVFVSPHYSICGDQGEWACPDLVALNFRERRVSVVEVSTAWNPRSLREKVRDCNKQWITRLRDQLRDLDVVVDSWQFDVQLFVRRAAVQAFEQRVAGIGAGVEIRVKALEDLGAPWEWARD